MFDRSIPWLLVGALCLPPSIAAGDLERVPQDGTLDQALSNVSNGGVIEIAAGTYPAPANGFRYTATSTKTFTVRAAAGAQVVLDGQGQRPIFVIDGRGLRKRLTFENLVFRDGFSADRRFGGAVTLDAARADFLDCRFEGNDFTSDQAGGGAARITDGSEVRFFYSVFEGNSSIQRGGAIYLTESELEIHQSRFIDNVTNRQGHGQVSIGGAVFLVDSDLLVIGSRFEGNEAGWTGGAIYAFGNYGADQTVPTATLDLVNSTFELNKAETHPCCTVPSETAGGAVHVEEAAYLLVEFSRFFENVANWGGAISSYRARMEIHDSVFRENEAIYPGSLAAGGTFNLTSNDFPRDDVNRPTAAFSLFDSLVQGVGMTTATQQGGCLFAVGDVNRHLGINGVPRGGTAAENRIPIDIERSSFIDCAVTGTVGTGLGGAMYLNLAQLDLRKTLLLDSHALGDGAGGGAILTLGETAAAMIEPTFARNSAERRGGGLLMLGADVDIDDAWFLQNDVSPAEQEPIQRAAGAAIVMSPDFGDDRDATGVVRRSLLTDNVGLAIGDLDQTDGPFNRVKFNDNRFHETTFGGPVYRNTILGGGGFTPDELNGLVVDHGGAPPVDKSDGGNTALGSSPILGRMQLTPSQVVTAPAAGDPAPPFPAYLGYAWSGGQASIGDDDLPATTGLLVRTGRGHSILSVDSVEQKDIFVRTTSEPGVPVRPTRLTATLEGPTSANLKWRDNSYNENEFLIFRKEPGEKFKLVGSVDADVRSFLDTGLEPGTTYIYACRGRNRIGTSKLSERPRVTTP